MSGKTELERFIIARLRNSEHYNIVSGMVELSDEEGIARLYAESKRLRDIPNLYGDVKVCGD